MKILVIGDSCRDIFVYGNCDRLEPTAPAPVFNPFKTVENGGMALNVQKNIASFGAEADLCTNKNWKDITKTRFIDYKTNHMLMRLDKNDDLYESIAFEKLKKIRFTDYDGVAISDYNKGFLSEEHIEYISSNHDATFLDTKKTLGAWAEKVSYIKINQAEYKRSEDRLSDAFEEKLIVTMGPRGARYNNVIYAVPEVQIKDLSGAGDTFIASLVVKYIETGSMQESIKFANESATLVVQRRGVGIVK